MALFPFSPGLQPLGYMDVLDSQLSSIKGGEVMTIGEASRENSASETAAADVLDGYDYFRPSDQAHRPVAQLATAAVEPNYLADDGVGPNYFTMLGTVVGGSAGKVVSSGAANGPHSATASGKVTLWDKPGIYVVTVDALAATFVSSLSASGLSPGSVIGHTSAGLLQHSTANSAISGSGIGTFVEFSSSESLVNTPRRLVGASEQFTQIKLHWHAGYGTRVVPTNPS